MALSRRRLLSTGGTALFSLGGLALAACGAGQGSSTQTGQPAQSGIAARFDQPTEITFWHTQSGALTKAIDELVAKFNTTNDKKITVKSEFIPGSYNGLFEKNQVALQAGTPVDASVAYESHVAEYMRGGWNIDLEDYVKDKTLGLSKESLEDVFPAYLDGVRFGQYGNKMLSWPFAKSLLVMYVNEEVMTRAGIKSVPKTWPEFQAAIQQASRGDTQFIIDANQVSAQAAQEDPTRRRSYGWGNSPDASTINAWVYSRGGTALTADNKQVRWNEPPYLEAFQFAEDAYKRQYAFTPPRTPGRDFDFISNRMGFTMQTSTSRPFIRQVAQANSRQSLPWRIAMIPQKDPAKPATVQFGPNVALFKTTPQKQAAAWAFVKWFTERDQDVAWAMTSNYMPIRKSSAETAQLKGFWEKDDPQGKQAFELIKHARPEPNVRGSDPLRGVIQKALFEVIDGKTTSKQALEAAAKEANEILARS